MMDESMVNLPKASVAALDAPPAPPVEAVKGQHLYFATNELELDNALLKAKGKNLTVLGWKRKTMADTFVLKCMAPRVV